MSESGERRDFGPAWSKFQEERRPELSGWLEAERALAGSQGSSLSADSGDRLLAAEAALQRAIVDFAAMETGEGDPTPLALELLRLAEALLYDAPGDGPGGERGP